MRITYTLRQVSPSVQRITRGRRSVGTLTLIGGVWHGRLRIADSDPITAKGPDPVAVFNAIVDQRAEAFRN